MSLIGAQLAAHSAALPAQQLPVQTPAAAERIDFVQLVDTITRAREQAAPQVVHATLTHAEFGAVAMKFHHDGEALTVSLSSADPGFVTAANSTQPATDGAGRQDSGSRQAQRDNAQQGGAPSSGQTATQGSGQGTAQGQGQPAQTQSLRRSALAASANASNDLAEQAHTQTDSSGRFA